MKSTAWTSALRIAYGFVFVSTLVSVGQFAHGVAAGEIFGWGPAYHTVYVVVSLVLSIAALIAGASGTAGWFARFGVAGAFWQGVFAMPYVMATLEAAKWSAFHAPCTRATLLWPAVMSLSWNLFVAGTNAALFAVLFTFLRASTAPAASPRA